ncbi:MAG: THUMP domain-containing protein [Acidobacteriota bacterium]
MTEHAFLIRLSGEVSLKGKRTRNRFVDRLIHNLADALRSHGYRYRFERRWSRILFFASSADAADVATRIFGVRAVASMEKRRWRSLEDLVDQGGEIFAPDVAGRTFAVRVHRGEHASKTSFASPEVERALGTRLLPGAAGVRLKNPDVEVHVELRGDDAYFYPRPALGEGGLPLGTEGRGLTLFSGGLDSPVAAWAVQRRGVASDFLFCNLAGDSHLRDVVRVAKVLVDRWSYGTAPQLVVVDLRPVAEDIKRLVKPRLRQVVLKRQMYRIGAEVASSLGSQVLVTGEAIGQVSSQTLNNLAVTSGASSIPVLRPLVAWNKGEIVERARRIGTFSASSRVAEYCGLDGDMAPAARAKAAAIEAAELTLDPRLLADSIDRAMSLDLRSFAFESDGSALGVDAEAIPEHAVLLDLRPARSFESWHPKGARSTPYPEVLSTFGELDPSPAYVAVCELGLKSAHLAELMSRAGYRCRHLSGGIGGLRKAVTARDGALAAALSPALRGPT